MSQGEQKCHLLSMGSLYAETASLASGGPGIKQGEGESK
jgi:hypothetical protein